MSFHKELRIRHSQKHEPETVLVLQGGGSLGAYECGVFKALYKAGIAIDIVSGTSIGAVNAGIIAGSKTGRPDVDLEEFWLDLSEHITPSYLPDRIRAMVASYNSAVFGNAKMFSPMWLAPLRPTGDSADGKTVAAFPTFGWAAYLYDLQSLKRTVERYIDFAKLNSNENKPRLVVTATDMQRCEAVIFDSHRNAAIDADHVTACAGFPFYGIAWTKKDGRYLWDGALLSNTPLREVIDSSPRRDKHVYIVNLFPRYQQQIPTSMLEIWHRARDIVFTERTDQNIRMSKVISKYLLMLTEMHDILSNADLDDEMRSKFMKLEPHYRALAENRGAVIHDITKIERSEDHPFLFEDADFSAATIKKLIKQGEEDTLKALEKQSRTSQETPGG